MGLFDSIKKGIGGAAAKAEEALAQHQQHHPQQHYQQQHQHQPQHAAMPHAYEEVEEAPDSEPSSDEAFDLAGFDPQNDEDGYFEAELLMESEGMFGGTDDDRARIRAQYGIRDSDHWHTIKESVWQVLAQKHGSFDEAAQRMTNFRSQRAMQQQGRLQAGVVASGALEPVEGISLEKWAAINAAIVQGNSLEDLLKGNGIDRARWDRAKGVWEQRMSTDTTFAVAQVYGAAFQAASQSKYTALAKEANAARGANADPKSAPPMSITDYFRLMFEQEAASRAGTDPQAAIKAQGMTIVDWIDLSTFMGYYIARNAQRPDARRHLDQVENIRVEVLAKYPGVKKEDLDIQF